MSGPIGVRACARPVLYASGVRAASPPTCRALPGAAQPAPLVPTSKRRRREYASNRPGSVCACPQARLAMARRSQAVHLQPQQPGRGSRIVPLALPCATWTHASSGTSWPTKLGRGSRRRRACATNTTGRKAPVRWGANLRAAHHPDLLNPVAAYAHPQDLSSRLPVVPRRAPFPGMPCRRCRLHGLAREDPCFVHAQLAYMYSTPAALLLTAVASILQGHAEPRGDCSRV